MNKTIAVRTPMYHLARYGYTVVDLRDPDLAEAINWLHKSPWVGPQIRTVLRAIGQEVTEAVTVPTEEDSDV